MVETVEVNELVGPSVELEAKMPEEEGPSVELDGCSVKLLRVAFGAWPVPEPVGSVMLWALLPWLMLSFLADGMDDGAGNTAMSYSSVVHEVRFGCSRQV